VVAELPGDDVAAVIIEDCTEIEPAPTKDFDVGEVSLPQLVDPSRFVFELVRRLEHDECWAGDQIVNMYGLSGHFL